jgi:cystathionine beta-lyase
LSAPGNQDRTCIRIDHQRDADGVWRLDPTALEAACTPATRMLLLCHPQNPLGRDFTADELRAIGAVCRRRDLVLISDEIHCQLVLDTGRPFVSPATLDADLAARTITLLAPSKTYNIPGLACAFAVIPDRNLRTRFQRACAGLTPEITPLSLAACTAAYDHGEAWRQELLSVLRQNRDRVLATCQTTGLPCSRPEATYLAWLDVRGLGLPAGGEKAHFEQHGVGLHDGALFAAPGWLRLNFGCPPALLGRQLSALAAGVRAARPA